MRRISSKWRFGLRILAFLLLCVALTTTLFLGSITRAQQSTNRTIGFQGRLLDSEGTIVPNGSYNIEFKIYQGGSGTAAGNPDGTLVWTETYVNNGSATGGLQVRNGFMSVNLGSKTPFGSSVDWNAETLWLSMNVAGNAINCTTFGTGACVADGEMLPMKRITAAPYAINAGAVGGLTANNLLQLAQGVQNDASTNTPSIFINKTGSGNLVQLQNAATDVFTINQTGSITLGSASNQSISVAVAPAGTAGSQLSLIAGAGGSGTGSDGGDLVLQGGAAGGTNANGGNIAINAGAGTGTGSDGIITIGSVDTSEVIIGAGTSAVAGTTTIQAKNSVTIATDGTTRAVFSDTENTVYFGNGVSASAPSDFSLQGTGSTADGVDGGSLGIQGGNATAGNANGGNVTLSGGSGSGTGADGLVVITTPTFLTVNNDANCYTDSGPVAASCSVTQTTIDSAAAVIVGFSTADQTATLPDPTIDTPGRIFYVTAAGDSEDFTLSINAGGAGNTLAMTANTTASFLWNGNDWTIVNASGATPPSGLTQTTTEGIDRVQVGDGEDLGAPTLLTVDRASSAPIVTDDALLGSMYYDTTLGKIQCYEATGWGPCRSAPDNFVTLSPEYSNAVTNGAGIGTMTSDICSGTLGINDGSGGQPTVCASNETYNFYNWSSSESTAQTKSIYVTYELPSTFKQFTAGSTSLMGRTDSADASVSYQIYRNNGSGLTECGTATGVSTGAQSAWQTALASGGNDPSGCGFMAGDSIVVRINLSASNSANAYVSNLNFTFSNN